MATHIGRPFRCVYANHWCEVMPLPHPSAASPWPRVEPGKTLLHKALGLIAEPSAWADLFARLL